MRTWYIVRNQIIGNVEAPFKFRTTDRFVLLHNTLVNWGTAWPGDSFMCCNEDHLLRAIDRFVEFSELRRELAPFYSAIGRPSLWTGGPGPSRTWFDE